MWLTNQGVTHVSNHLHVNSVDGCAHMRLSYIYIYLYVCVTVQGCTGILDELVGSHTRLVIYPALAICCQRVVICALLDTRFKGMQVVTYQANIKQLKSH